MRYAVQKAKKYHFAENIHSDVKEMIDNTLQRWSESYNLTEVKSCDSAIPNVPTKSISRNSAWRYISTRRGDESQWQLPWLTCVAQTARAGLLAPIPASMCYTCRR